MYSQVTVEELSNLCY